MAINKRTITALSAGTPASTDVIPYVDITTAPSTPTTKKTTLANLLTAATYSASNVGTGQGVFKQLSSNDFEFYNLKAGSSKITVALDTNDIEIDLGSVASTDLSDTAAITYLADLASTANGDGAALIGIEDSGGLITATTVEGALAENRTAIDAIEADYLTSSDIGTNVQAYDAELAALAGLTSAANKIPMFSGSGTATLLDFVDEDTMTSDSATALASQQSIKAYVDAQVSGGSYTDEQAQDAVGGILSDSSEIDFTYNDGAPSISASIVAASIDESKLDTSVNASLDLADSALQSADIGSTVQAYDAELAALAGLTSAANKIPYFTGSGTAGLLDFVDEDDMTSDSATSIPSQQSVKAYVDANAGGSSTRYEFVPASAGNFGSGVVYPFSNVYGLKPARESSTGHDYYCTWYVPDSFTSLTAAYVYISNGSGGSIGGDVSCNWGAVGESISAGSGSVSNVTSSVSFNTIGRIAFTSALSGIAGGDLVGVHFNLDTDNTRCFGFLFVYE